MTHIRIGSRGSQLALWQSRWVAGELEKRGFATTITVIKTTGDKITGVPLSQVGTKGLFTKELEEALLAEEIDIAVHSLKDMPTELPEGLALAATPVREDARDAMIGSTMEGLKKGAKVGTSSLRRTAQLRQARPDVVIESVRGNLDTRLRKLDEGQYDAILLAAAGLKRLGWAERIAELLPVEVMCPAVGQGALAIEARVGGGAESAAVQACRALEDAATRAAVTAERAVLAALGGGCQVPIGAHAVVTGDRLDLRAVVVAPEGKSVPLVCLISGAVSEAAALGQAAADELLAAGADDILEAVYGA
ncbi:MAG: hydroxymethylbilane synthase [Acidobacteria bacterium]|nr:hydroxymethylbilane synthase [Acidobacteriota bacterium]